MKLKKIAELWEKLGDIPVDEDCIYIEEPFHIWAAREKVEDIWHWFDDVLAESYGTCLGQWLDLGRPESGSKLPRFKNRVK